MFSRSKGNTPAETSGASGSNRTPTTPINPGTVIFNVGGQRFEISQALIGPYPGSKLSQLFQKAQQQQQGPNSSRELFIDHNPAAFAVILDYLRYSGRLLVPKSVCTSVVLLQMQAFGLPVKDELIESSAEEPPAYSSDEKGSGFNQVVGQGLQGGGGSLSQTVSAVMEGKMHTLIENYIYPLVLDHAKHGHPRFEIFLVDAKIKQSDVADTISDDLPAEWIFLTDKALRFGDSSSSYSSSSLQVSVTAKPSESNDIHEKLMSMIKDLDGISMLQREKLVSTIAKSRETQRTSASGRINELPDVEYLVKSGLFSKMEDMIRKRTSVRKCLAERKDLTVRNENEFGLLESMNVLCVKLLIEIV
jgi:hypothetical protein